MALRKEPGRRYASAEQLARDVERHLAGRPVVARPDTVGYRLGKFLRRNRRAVAAVLATLTLIVALVGFYTRRLAIERDRAQREERETAQVASFLVEIFGAADPEQARGEELTAREILDLAAVRLKAELGDQPALRADLLEHVTSIYLRLGLHPQAEALLDEVEELRRRLHGPEHPEVADVLHLRGRWLQAADDVAAAKVVHRQGLELRRRLLGPDRPEVADSLTDLANAFYAAAEYERASELFREALELRRRVLAPDDPAIATSLNDLGAALRSLRRREEAEPLLHEALARRLEHFGELHPAVAESSSTLASILAGLGHQAEARELFRRALAIRKTIYGPDHPIVGVSLNNLGNQLRMAGDPAAAEPLLREAVALYRARPSSHRDALRRSLANLAEVLRLSGRPAEAALAYQESLDVSRALGSPDRTLSNLLWKLGDCHLEADDLAAAEGAYREMLRLRLAHHPPDHARVASPRLFLARVMLRRGEVGDAVSLLEPSLEVLRRERPEHWLAAEAEILLGDCRLRQGRPGEARAHLESGLGILAGAGGTSAVALEARERLERQAAELAAAVELRQAG